jgi:hypothetical protein
MGTPTDVDNEKEIAVVFGQMCAAFAIGAIPFKPSKDVIRKALDRYHDRIGRNLAVWDQLSQKILEHATLMGIVAAAGAVADLSTVMEPAHFLKAAKIVEKMANQADACRPIGFPVGTRCDVCPPSADPAQ